MKSKKICGFDKAWVGPCENEVENEEDRCEKHQEKCCSCGAPATRECPETGQFVCGYPLCDDCEHATFPDGTNGGVGFNEQSLPENLNRHVKKTEQQYEPWYARKEV